MDKSTKLSKSNRFPKTFFSDDSEEEAQTYSYSSSDDKKPKDQKMDSVFDIEDGDDVITVGEELFTEICDAWLNVHGSQVMEKILAKKKLSKGKSKKNRQVIPIKSQTSRNNADQCNTCGLQHTPGLPCAKLFEFGVDKKISK